MYHPGDSVILTHCLSPELDGTPARVVRQVQHYSPTGPINVEGWERGPWYVVATARNGNLWALGSRLLPAPVAVR